MAFFIPSRRRTRGVNFLLGGTVVAIAFVAFLVLGGQVDFGLGAPSCPDRPAADAAGGVDASLRAPRGASC